MHLECTDERQWFFDYFESGRINPPAKMCKKALQDVLESEMFEQYLHTKFPGAKRFSVESGEASIAAMECIISGAAQNGVKEVMIGMAHRGRLTTLTKVMNKPYHAVFSEFAGGKAVPDDIANPGDVKYHLGASFDREVAGHKIHMSLAPNPSHLELVNSVVLGRVRGKQDLSYSGDKSSVLGIQVHGDAAFSGQGSVMEALALNNLNGFSTGGTIHIVINNQIGFTTKPRDSRSTRYCTDIAKFIDAPIMHVNGDDIDAVVYAATVAIEYKLKYKKDIVLDVICYRKYGHNEGDEPLFTNPLMYAEVAKKVVPSKIYSDELISRGVLSAAELEEMRASFKRSLDEEFELSKEYKPLEADWFKGSWALMKPYKYDRKEPSTGVSIKTIRVLGKAICSIPDSFNINNKIRRQLEARATMLKEGEGIDWATGELLAYATLLNDGYGVRMTGQDVKRGTFSHRHAVLFDQNTEEEYIPLNNLSEGQKKFLDIHNSNLSELGVLGFEYGYSTISPGHLNIWEAQFGDFSNSAQMIIDQYISSAEAKWLRLSGIVLSAAAWI